MNFHFILSRYLIRNLLKWLGIITFIVIALIILFDASELIRRTSSRLDLTFTILVQLIIFKIPQIFQQVFPFIVLFSSLLTFWRLNRVHEITVLRALGISIWQIVIPLIFTVSIIGGVDLIVINPISSKMIRYYDSLNDKYFQNKIDNLTVADSGFWIREHQNTLQQIIHISFISPEKKILNKVSIFQYDIHNNFIKRFFARNGQFQTGGIKLEDVWEQAPTFYPQQKKSVVIESKVSFKTLENNNLSPESIPFWKLLKTAYLLEKSGLSGHKYKLAWHMLLAKWSLLSIMVIFAAACSLRPPRQHRVVLSMGMGVVGAFLLYFFQDISYALGNSGALPILISAWAPIGVSFLLSITILLYCEEG